MNFSKRYIAVFIWIYAFTTLNFVDSDETIISHIVPTKGSLNGLTAITIFGTGFAKNQFNLAPEEAHFGNKVNLVSSQQSYMCDVLKEASHETQITCNTRPMPEDLYNVRVQIDGENVADVNHCPETSGNQCQFQTNWMSTPQITSLQPISGPPGTIIKVTGVLFTSLVLSTDQPSTNGNTNRLERVVIGSHLCDLFSQETPDDLYGIALYNAGSSNNGWLKCKVTGNFIGNSLVSFLVDGPYGKSYPSLDTLFVSRSSELYMFQTYAVINSLNPNTGSLLGGTEIQISGNFFDAFKTKVTVGGKPCGIITPVTSTQISCKTESQSAVQSHCYPGNRGVHVHMWKNTGIENIDDLIDISALPMEGDNYKLAWVDGAGFDIDSDDMDGFSAETPVVIWSKGFFLPPLDGMYTFYWSVDHMGAVYFSETEDPADKVKILECADACTYNKDEVITSKDFDTQVSQAFHLTANKPYYFEILSSLSPGGGGASLGLRMSHSDYVETQTGDAMDERQKISISTTVIPEKQVIQFIDWSDTVDGINEVQKITVTSTDGNINDGASFQLNLYGASTDEMTLEVTSSELVSALQSLPSITSVTVTEQTVTGGKEFTVAFNDDLGDIPNLIGICSSLLNVKVAEITKGLKSSRNVCLKMANMVSAPVSYTADAEQLESVILDMFSVICHPEVDGSGVSSLLVRYHFDFEPPEDDQYPDWGTYDDGSSFCGRHSLTNPMYIFKTGGLLKALELARYPYACFAYRGDFKPKMRATFTWTFSRDVMTKDINADFNNLFDATANSDNWKYTCVPIYELIMSVHPDGDRYTLEKLQVYPSTPDSAVDEVQFRININPDLTGLLSVGREGPMNARLKDVSVTKTGDSEFHVTIQPYNCASDFEIFSIIGVETQSDTTTQDGQRTAVYWDERWPEQQRVEVQQTQQASPPVTGSYQLTFGGDTIDVEADTTESVLQAQLQTMAGMGHVTVEREGNCSGYSWTVHWIDALGDQQTIQVDGSNLAGSDVNIEVTTITDGGLLYKRIPGEMVRSCDEKPQVAVTVNDIPSRCTGNCNFEWTEDRTPKVTGIEPTSGSLASNTVLTITGSGFTALTSPESVLPSTVQIASVPCDITAHTETQILCSVGDGPLGTHNVLVNIQGKGLATLQQFTYEGHVTSITPVEASYQGGIALTITGSGFTSESLVTIGGNNCPVTTITLTVIHCIVPAKTPQSLDNAEVLVISSFGDLLSPQTFHYSQPSTPTVTEISQTSSRVWGGDVLGITGTLLKPSDASELTVTLCGTKADVLQSSASDIELTLPPNPPGSCAVIVQVGTLGNADISGVPDVEYQLAVHAVSPTKGSLFGGTKLTLQGEGFPLNRSLVDISLGEQHQCDVLQTSEDTIVCEVRSSAKLHRITNRGSDPVLGEGYAWEPSILQIESGDTVIWQWTAPTQVTTSVYSVQQIPDPQSNVPLDGGFSYSSKGTISGTFSHQFPTPGSYYYWSGKVDLAGFSMKGVIKVSEKLPFTEKIMVKIAGFEALYDTNSEHTVSPIGNCIGTTLPKSDCTAGQVDPSVGDTEDIFQWTYSVCHTPLINDIQPRKLFIDETLTVTGTGFGETSCENEILIGETACIVENSSEGSITCHIDLNQKPPVNTNLLPSLRVHNRGFALVESPDELQIVFDDFISGLLPQKGSTEGGTLVTIHGAGFPSSTQGITVYIGTTICTVLSIEYTSIICETRPSPAATNVPLMVLGMTDIPCTIDNNCVFSYTDDATILVDSISPSVLNGFSNPITLHGSFDGIASKDITITIGNVPCVVTSTTNSAIICQAVNLVTGSHAVSMRVNPSGFAKITNNLISVSGSIDSISPSEGSMMGGTRLVISGGIFASDSLSVTLGGEECSIESVNYETIVCITPLAPQGEGDEEVVVVTNAVTLTLPTLFRYTRARTPVLSDISPATASMSVRLQLRGAHFSEKKEDNLVRIGKTSLAVASANYSELLCDLPEMEAGSFNVGVTVNNLGRARAEEGLNFKFVPSVKDFSPNSGSFGGGQLLTFTGGGLMSSFGKTLVTICGQPCQLTNNSLLEIQCLTPEYIGTGTVVCAIAVTVNDFMVDDSLTYTYDGTQTSTITNLFPRRAGTGGGTKITIEGSNFGEPSEVSVTIADIVCDVDPSETTSTVVICVTNSIPFTTKTKVRLQVGEWGIASQQNADFEFIDRWSSLFTWGGESLPIEGDLVVIRENQTVLLDTDTPILKMILIQGGSLIFDRKDIELNAESILVTNGGVFEIGTEDEPFVHKAQINLHGHVKSKELPIYGTKTLAVRQGTLDIHGHLAPVTWTQLGETAEAGSTVIKLKQPVTWRSGDQIVLATTGDLHSQQESEERSIASVSDDGTVITLHEPLEYSHLSVDEIIAGVHVEIRGEVGLLTHNIRIQGSNDQQLNMPETEVCDTSLANCFESQPEILSSGKFGCHIIIHGPPSSTTKTVARLEHVEITSAGQEFRRGRHPIHFYLSGDMDGSYVRGCAIHKSFNRAINIRGTHKVSIENNVAYDILGGAFFLEDGIETGNTFQYNLVVNVQSSTRLRSDDITPAAYWIANADNTYRGNTAAGGTQFGFLYCMNQHPKGLSFTRNICPQKVPLREFYNNTAHSMGLYGLWIQHKYTPMKNGGCRSQKAVPAVYKRLIAWNCKKGAECVNCGDIQFVDFVLINNQIAGIETKDMTTKTKYSPKGPLLADGLIVGHTNTISGDTECTRQAITLPYDEGLIIQNMVFVNFDRNCETFGLTTIQSSYSKWSGGFRYHTKEITLINSPNLYNWRWLQEGIIDDLDGSLTSQFGNKLLPWTDILPPDSCDKDLFFGQRSKVEGAICSADVTLNQFKLIRSKPNSLRKKKLIMKNAYGSTMTPWAERKTNSGWMMSLVANHSYTLSFDGVAKLTNISYYALYHRLQPGEWIIVRMELAEKPDRVQTKKNDKRVASTSPLSYTGNVDGDWYYDVDKQEISYLVSNDGHKKEYNSVIDFAVSTCYFPNCEKKSELTDGESRPDNALMWSHSSTWESLGRSKPLENENFTIPKGVWIVVDENPPKMGTLIVEGTLEFEHEEKTEGGYFTFDLHIDFLIIKGRFIIGWPNKPFKGSASISVHGTRDSPQLDYQSAGLDFGPILGAKVIGVFGRLDLHGSQHNVMWTELKETAHAGSTQITLEDQVDWTSLQEIVITTTSYNAWHTETFTITAISSDQHTLTLNDPLKYTHLGNDYDVPGDPATLTHSSYNIKAKVGLLTRNIKIIGATYDQMEQSSFGARVLVSSGTGIDRFHVGSARLSNIEFYNTGQEGFTESYDPRFSLAFLGVGDVSKDRPSEVTNCSFHHGFSTAIGVFGTNDLVIENNIMHHTIGNGIEIQGKRNQVINNLVGLCICPGMQDDDTVESANTRWIAGIEAARAEDLTMNDNVVAGSERSGYHVAGELCSISSPQYTNNEAIGVLSGVTVFPHSVSDFVTEEDYCTLLNGFTITRAYDFGIYYQGEADLRVTNSLFVENGVGVFPMVTRPPSRTHQKKNKFVKISKSTFIGSSPDAECSPDIQPDDDRLQISRQARSYRSNSGGRIAMCWPNFVSEENGAPRKPWCQYTSYAGIGGKTIVSDCHFAHFTMNRCGQQDVIFSPNPDNQEVHHPLTIKKSTHADVNLAGKAFIPRPDLRKVNPLDCEDMDCDGMKAVLLIDTDGSLTDHPSTLISQAEFEWNENPQRGLGDHRIPQNMLTNPIGDQLNISHLAPEKGIIRNENCVYHEDWQAYECTELQHKMLVIESLDSDSETRRLSPVAILGEGYLNLINGPEDHGTCESDACKRRLSTFFALVATGHNFDIHFSSTNPQKLRLTLLNASPTDAVRVAIYYEKPERLDVYVDGIYSQPNNAIYNDNSQMVFQPPDEGNFMPDVYNLSSSSGENYFDKLYKKLYVLVKGPHPIDIVVSPRIVLSLTVPFASLDEFYGERLVNNLALFLGISINRIRVLNIVREGKKRRKRATESTIEVEITDELLEEINILNNETESNIATAREAMTDMGNSLKMNGQLGLLGDALNISVLSMEMEQPMPVSGSPEWQDYAVAPSRSDQQIVLIPVEMDFLQGSNTAVEFSSFNVIPVIHLLDAQGGHVHAVGSVADPWQVSVSLVNGTGSDPEAYLTGSTKVTVIDGYANFSDLSISHEGTGFKIEFMVTTPPEGNKFVKRFGPLTITKRKLNARDTGVQTTVVKNSYTSVTLEIIDQMTKQKAPNIFWKGHTWTCSISLSNNTKYVGKLTTVVDTYDLVNDTTVTFSGLKFSEIGQTAFVFECRTFPESDYGFVAESSIFTVIRPENEQPVTEVEKRIEIKFKEDFATILGTENLVIAILDNYLIQRFTEVICGNYTLWQGSIMVGFTMAGPETAVSEAVEEVWLQLQSGLSLSVVNVTLNAAQYLKVDGKRISVIEVQEAEDESLNAGIIIAICICIGLLIIISIMLLIIYSKKSKMKVVDCGNEFVTSSKLKENNPYAIATPRTGTFLSEKSVGALSEFDETKASRDENQKDSVSITPDQADISNEELLHNPSDLKSLGMERVIPSSVEIQGSIGNLIQRCRPVDKA